MLNSKTRRKLKIKRRIEAAKKKVAGAWGHGPLDNDAASDQKWDIGSRAIEGLDEQLMSRPDDVGDQVYHAIGLWLDVDEKLKTQYDYFTDDIRAKMYALSREAVEWLLENPDVLIKHYRNPDEVRGILSAMQKDIESREEALLKEHSDGTVQAKRRPRKNAFRGKQ